MRIKEIEYSFLKNIGNYENQRVTYRGELESWENPEQSMELLRNRVATELDLPDQYYDLRDKCDRKLAELEALKSEIEVKKTELVRAQQAWDNFAEFLVGHGVDPTTLTIENFQNTRIEHPPSHTRFKKDFDPLGDVDEDRENYYELQGYYPDRGDGRYTGCPSDDGEYTGSLSDGGKYTGWPSDDDDDDDADYGDED